MAYLITHHGTFWFQIRVPKPLVPVYGTIIRQNLQTKDRKTAQTLAYRLASHWLERFATERPNISPDSVEAESAPTFPSSTDQVASPEPPPNPTVAFPEPESEQPTPRIRQKHARKKPSKSEITDTLDGLYEYWRQLNPGCAPSTFREVKAMVREFNRIVRKNPSNLERTDITGFRDRLLKKGSARGTVAKKVGFISTLLQTAVDGGLLPYNVARGLRVPKPKVQLQRRRAITKEELKRIFSSPVYTQGKRYRGGGGEAEVWVPILALATGARLEELCQLMVEDIVNDPEHGPLMRITDEGEQQRVKTMGSRRHVPLHSGVIAAGFLDYVAEVQEQGYDWLFPDLEPDHDGRRGGNFSKWFARYLRSPKGCNIQDQRVVFHSFRHTFKSLAREAGIPEEVHDALTGHCASSVGRGYGHVPTKVLVEAMAKLELPVTFPRLTA